jgi:hypothetical protein
MLPPRTSQESIPGLHMKPQELQRQLELKELTSWRAHSWHLFFPQSICWSIAWTEKMRCKELPVNNYIPSFRCFSQKSLTLVVVVSQKWVTPHRDWGQVWITSVTDQIVHCLSSMPVVIKVNPLWKKSIINILKLFLELSCLIFGN